MFETIRTVYRHKEGVIDLIDESNMNVVSGCETYKNKTEKLQIWKQLKQQYGDNISVIFGDKIINYTCKVDRSLYL
jgi:hypothetical protein